MSETNSSDYIPPPPPSSPIQLSKQKCIDASASFIIDNSKCVDTTPPPQLTRQTTCTNTAPSHQLTRQLSIQTTSNDNLNFKCDCDNNDNNKKHINNRLIRSGFDVKK
jgi:hypothetical protein